MERVVIYGIGSPIVVDVQESIARAGIEVAAAIRNMACEVRLLKKTPFIELAELTSDILTLPFLAPFFTPANRQKVMREAFRVGFRSAYCLIDPSVPQPRSLSYGPGLYVNAGCTLGAASEFDEFVFVNRGSSIGHHARFGAFVSIGPGAVVAGSVKIGRGSVVGAGAVVMPELSIGSNSVIGAGSVVTKDVPDNCLVLGVPARVTRSGIAGFGDQSIT
jgi:sugar O-acyltransferase (sialic acid O-acetyltransferase NeuD family)